MTMMRCGLRRWQTNFHQMATQTAIEIPGGRKRRCFSILNFIFLFLLLHIKLHAAHHTQFQVARRHKGYNLAKSELAGERAKGKTNETGFASRHLVQHRSKRCRGCKNSNQPNGPHAPHFDCHMSVGCSPDNLNPSTENPGQDITLS